MKSKLTIEEVKPTPPPTKYILTVGRLEYIKEQGQAWRWRNPEGSQMIYRVYDIYDTQICLVLDALLELHLKIDGVIPNGQYQVGSFFARGHEILEAIGLNES